MLGNLFNAFLREFLISKLAFLGSTEVMLLDRHPRESRSLSRHLLAESGPLGVSGFTTKVVLFTAALL